MNAHKGRPQIKLARSTRDKALDIVGISLLVLLWYIVLLAYSKLPEAIPTHFDLSGNADAHGDRSNIFPLPIMATVLYLCITWLNRYPHLFNYLDTITEQNARQHYTAATRMMRYLKLMVVFVFLAIAYGTIDTASGGEGSWAIAAAVAAIILLNIISIAYLVKSSKI